MSIKIILFSSILILISCNFSAENRNLKKITDVCEFVDIKLEIYQEINLFYDKYSVSYTHLTLPTKA